MKNHLVRKLILASLGGLFIAGSLSTALRYAFPWNLLKPKKLSFHLDTDETAFLKEYSGILDTIPERAHAGIFSNDDSFAFFQFNTYPRTYQKDRLNGDYTIVFQNSSLRPDPLQLGERVFQSENYHIYKRKTP